MHFHISSSHDRVQGALIAGTVGRCCTIVATTAILYHEGRIQMGVIALCVFGIEDYVSAIATLHILSYRRHDEDLAAFSGLANIPVDIVFTS